MCMSAAVAWSTGDSHPPGSLSHPRSLCAPDVRGECERKFSRNITYQPCPCEAPGARCVCQHRSVRQSGHRPAYNRSGQAWGSLQSSWCDDTKPGGGAALPAPDAGSNICFGPSKWEHECPEGKHSRNTQNSKCQHQLFACSLVPKQRTVARFARQSAPKQPHTTAWRVKGASNWKN